MNNLIISGKLLPNLGGGWSSSNYKVNEFVKKCNYIGLMFKNQNAGHFKAYPKDIFITDSLTISLHNPTTDAAKDIIRYMSKYYIIKLGYVLMNQEFVANKKFAEHEDILFQRTNDLETEVTKNNIIIDRRFIIEYVKKCFFLTKKIDFNIIVKAQK